MDRRNDSLCSMASYVLRVSGSISRLSDVEFHDKGMILEARIAVELCELLSDYGYCQTMVK